jgi:hypothetical protein
MDKPLRVLHLEDQPEDAELVHAALAADGLQCQIRIVDTRQGFVEALDGDRPDIILSDFSLPGIDGLSALAIARERATDVPFILVSGTLGEEAAVDSLRSGATDYVLKHRLARLAPAVRRAVAEAAEARKRSQAERMFRTLLENAPDALILVDRDGTIVLLNARAEHMFGYARKELLGQGMDALLSGASRGEHAALRAGYFADPAGLNTAAARELRGRRKDGKEFPVEISLSPLDTEDGMLVTNAIRDISDRKQLEAQLLQSQKMEAIGLLAGGVAHDFNNLLNVISGYGEMLLKGVPNDDPKRGRLEQILGAAARAASLTRQLLAFSRKDVIQTRVLDLNAILVEMEKMLRRLIGEDIDLTVRTEPGLGRVKADRGQIEQIVMNLVVNARDAMPKGGKLTLRTTGVEVDPGLARRHPGARPGSYVCLEVSDNGVGMKPDVKEHIFEPFFTTKPMGQGTGLGLATVYGIIEQGGGFLSVDSEPGRGTTFRIRLPAVAESPETVRPEAADARSLDGSETILLVEDEAVVRNLTREILQSYGYTVLEAADVDEAHRLCEKHGAEIHLLLTDVVMPRMSGRELAARLTAFHPGIKVLYMSGYADDTLIKHGVAGPGVPFLQKPFTPTGLARKVRDVLERKPVAPGP